MLEINKTHMSGLKKLLENKHGKRPLKLSEQQEESLQREIARESSVLAARLIASSEETARGNIGAAINLLTQALILATDNTRASRRLLNVARRLARRKT